jgi:bacterial/archaeal transporter family-2 protein
VLVGLPAAFGVGALVALQAKVNGALATRVGGGITGGIEAALISFSTGLVLLGIATACSPVLRGKLADVVTAVRERLLRRWQLIGGACGAYLVSTQGLTVHVIGVALFTVAVVAGQAVGSLAVDHAGLGPAGRRPVTTGRVVGTVIAVAAVVLSVSGQIGLTGGLSGSAWFLLILPLVAGLGTTWQQAMNGRVAVVGSSGAATVINFVVGTTVLVLVTGLAAGLVGGLGAPPANVPGDLWLYAGGPMGIAFIWLAAKLVRTLGVLLLGLGTVAGQVVGALVIDLVTDHPLTWQTGIGALLTLVGVAVAALAGRFPSPSRRPAAR